MNKFIASDTIGVKIENADPIDLDVFYIIVELFTQYKNVLLERT